MIVQTKNAVISSREQYRMLNGKKRMSERFIFMRTFTYSLDLQLQMHLLFRLISKISKLFIVNKNYNYFCISI